MSTLAVQDQADSARRCARHRRVDLLVASAGPDRTPRSIARRPRVDRLPATAPGTVAGALAAAGHWDNERPVDIDAFDWCYRAQFAAPLNATLCSLNFAGLATEAEVWLNGQLLLTADNMFRAYRADVTGRLQDENELVCIFRSLDAALKRRKPRRAGRPASSRNSSCAGIGQASGPHAGLVARGADRRTLARSSTRHDAGASRRESPACTRGRGGRRSFRSTRGLPRANRSKRPGLCVKGTEFPLVIGEFSAVTTKPPAM